MTDKLSDEEREQLRDLLDKGGRPEGEIGIGFGPWKFWVKNINFLTFLFSIYIIISLYLFYDYKKDTMEAHRLLSEQNAEMAFLQTLTPEQRVSLGLEMPPSLAKRIFRQQQEHERRWK